MIVIRKLCVPLHRIPLYEGMLIYYVTIMVVCEDRHFFIINGAVLSCKIV